MTTTEPRLAHPPAVAGPDPGLSIRPRLRHDALFADTGDGVLLRRAGGDGFVLRGRTAYRFTASLAPLLTGELTVAELCANLTPARQRMVVDFVRTLIERGLVRDVRTGAEPSIDEPVRDRFAAQLNYVAHYVDDAARRFLDFRSTRVLVLGAGATSRAAALGLLHNGLEEITLTGAPAVPVELAAAAAELTAAGCPARVGLDPEALTPAGLSGHDMATAPADSAGAMARSGYDVVIAPADGVGLATLSRLCTMIAGDGPVVLPAAMVGGQVIAGPLVRPAGSPCWTCALLRLSTNCSPGAMAALWRDIGLPQLTPANHLGAQLGAMVGNLLAYETFRLRTGCLDAETEGAVLIQDASTLEVWRERLLAHPLCPSCRDRQPASTAVPALPTNPTATPRIGVEPAGRDLLDAMLDELDDLVGRRVGVLSGFADTTVDQSPVKVGRVRIGAAIADGAPARLVTAFDLHHVPVARRTAVRAAALVYVGELGSHAAAVPDSGRDGIAAAELVTSSGLPFDGGRSWVPAIQLGTGAVRLVPAAAVYPFSRHNDSGACERSSAGDGAGSTMAEATEAGLLSALAYLSLRDAVCGRPGRLVPLEPAEPGSEHEFLRRTLDTLGLAVTVLDLAPAGPYHVLLARTDANPPLWTVGAALDGRQALVVALRDLIGLVQLGSEVDTGAPLLAGLDARAINHAGTASLDGPVTTYADVLENLAERGLSALAVHTTTPDLAGHGGVTTARVLLRRLG